MEILLAVGVAAFVLFIVVVGVLQCYKVASPTEALVVTGRSKEGVNSQSVSIGGGRFVVPVIQKYQKISLESFQVPVKVSQVPSKDKIRLDVEAVVTAKVLAKPEAVRAAAERFGDNHKKVAEQVQDNLAGTLRSVIGEMTVEQILGDRMAFAKNVTSSVDDTIIRQGLYLDSFQINEVLDKEGYIQNLGRPQAAQVLSEALVAESDRKREAEQKDLANQVAISDSTRETEIKKAENKKAVDASLAEAESVKPREDLRWRQDIIKQDQMVAEQEALLVEQKLNAEVRKTADAELYRKQTEADAKKYEAQAQADAKVYDEIKIAEAITLRGNADADAIKARGLADAEATTARAEALEKYGEAAMMEMTLKAYEKSAEIVGQGISSMGDVTIVSTDGMGKFNSGITDAMASLPAVMQGFMGSDGIKNISKNLVSGAETKTTETDSAKAGNSYLQDFVDKEH